MSLGHTLATNAVYRILNIFIHFLLTVLLTRLMGVDGYGLLSLLIATVTVYNLATSLGLDAGITYHAASGKITTSKMIWLLVWILAGQVVIAFLIESVIMHFTGRYLFVHTDRKIYLLATIGFVLATSVTDKFTALLNGHHLYTILNKTLFITNVFILGVFTVLFFLPQEQSSYFYLMVYIGAFLLQAVMLVIIFYQNSGTSLKLTPVSAGDTRLFFSYSFLVFAANLVQFFAYRADYWILNYYYNEKEVGWYALAVKLVQLFWIIPNLLASILFPGIAADFKLADEKTVTRLVRIMNGVNVLLVIISISIIWIFIPLFFGSSYQPSVPVFVILLPGTVLFCITTVLAAYFAGVNRVAVNLGGSVICLVVVLLLDFLLIPVTGKTGAAIASTIAYSLSTFYSLYRFARITRQPVLRILVPDKTDIRFSIQTIRRLIGTAK